MSEQLQQLKSIFHEIFQLDQADLDFGIYRIMRQKRDDVDDYLENQLLKDLKLTAEREKEESAEAIQRQIIEAKDQAFKLGYDVDNVPRVKQLEEKLHNTSLKDSLEDSVLSDLVQFLGRYYKDGDFLSLPRYRKNSYAIEYNGEEVKLHWANHDQYYVKTAERFRDYRFRLPNDSAIHFKITAANTETGNNKAETGKERRFGLLDKDFMREENGELLIFFRYAADEQKRKQADINHETVKRILEEGNNSIEWRKALSNLAPTENNKSRTLLEKHLTDYTARNTFDYFIHKDLEGFLRRELDFYIKNEIVMLDDIENEDAPRVELYLAKVKALRRIGHKLIRFLAQVENFCKKLFLKKKFVIRANYCATLDRVPRRLWTDVLASDAQIEEWRELYAIDDIEGNLINGSGKLNEAFLEANQNLVIDTRHFSEDWKLQLLESFDDLDANTDGLLIKADNFHALNLLQEKYHEAVKCIHIDPPYNTDTSGFLYKNGYQHSSWLSMMENRIVLGSRLMTDDASQICHIDENEYERLRMLYEIISNEYVSTIIWDKRNPMNAGKGIATQHEYIIWQTKREEPLYLRNDSILSMLEAAKEIVKKHGTVTPEARKEFTKWLDSNDILSGGEKAYRYLDDEGKIYQSVSLRAPEPRTDPKFHQPLIHPITQKPCPIPPNGFSRTPGTLQAMIERGEIIFGADENTQPRQKTLLTDTTRRQISSVIQDAKKGKADLLPLGLDFPYCHPTSLYEKLIGTAAQEINDIILDFFAGSGTTAHSIINLNRDDEGNRKYILVETNEYFDSVTLPRVKKVVYSKDWKDGKPVSREGSPHLLKYFALESYEDAMNNLQLNRKDELEAAKLQFSPEFQEDYLLNYSLEFETQSSQSLLNLDNFAAPFDYKMKIAVNGVGETQETPVDLVETFNYLIGLYVENMRQIDGFRVVRGKTRTGERCLILWRTTKDLKQESADKRLNDFLEKQRFDFSEIDTLYINGDAAIPVGDVRAENAAWQIKMIEAEFLKRMFEGN